MDSPGFSHFSVVCCSLQWTDSARTCYIYCWVVCFVDDTLNGIVFVNFSFLYVEINWCLLLTLYPTTLLKSLSGFFVDYGFLYRWCLQIHFYFPFCMPFISILCLIAGILFLYCIANNPPPPSWSSDYRGPFHWGLMICVSWIYIYFSLKIYYD